MQPTIDPITGRPVPSRPYKDEQDAALIAGLNSELAKHGIAPAPTYTKRADTGDRTRRADQKVSEPVNKGIDATLSERGSRYGVFTVHATITQGLKAVMHSAPNWRKLQPDQKEALEMVQHKIGRILNGDPDFHDSWFDVVGYAKLVADRLEVK